MTSRIPLAIADLELQLATAISVADTTFELSSAVDDDGEELPAGKYCFTIDNGQSNKEYLFGQLNGTTVTEVQSISRQGAATSGALRAHRVGASVILTDFAVIQRIAAVLRGEDPLDGANPVSYDEEPTLTDGKQIATVAYVLAVVNGGAVAFDNQIITAANGGESLVAGNHVYFDAADQEWKKTDADTAGTIEGVQRGIARGIGSNGAPISGGVQIGGVYPTTSLTPGAIYYYSNTAGAIGTSAGTVKRVAGIALSSTRFLMAPTSAQLPSTRQMDALAGTSGTPSTDNKFVTAADVSAAGGADKIVRLSGSSLPKEIPLTKLLVDATQRQLPSSDNTDQDLATATVPANMLNGNAIRVRIWTSGWTDDGNTFTMKLKYGATTLVTLTLTTNYNENLDNGFIEALIIGTSASAQKGGLTLDIRQTGPSVAGTELPTLFMQGYGTAAEDSTQSKTLAVAINSSNASANKITIEMATMEYLK